MSTVVYWFRNDLRLEDNPGFKAAVEENTAVIPVYVLDESWLYKTQFGIKRMGNFRLNFLLESLSELKENLKAIGSDLLVKVGNPLEQILAIYQQFNCAGVYAQALVAYEETTLQTALNHLVPCKFVWGHTLFHERDLPFRIIDTPGVFTEFRKAVEKNAKVRPVIKSPLNVKSPDNFGNEVPTPEKLGFERPFHDERSVLNFAGGESQGLERLNYYLWEKELLGNYKQTRNGLIGGDYSSKFSPWLAHGCISPRQIYWQVKKFEKYIKKNSSTYWLIFELIWRDFFQFVALQHGAKLYRRKGITGKEKITWSTNKHFHLWANGQTTEPFVDANMNELNRTGFMSNRGRQIVASYLIHRMRIDWRLGAAYFEKMLIDHDPASNYGNWLYISGVGNDPRGGREFNIERQTQQYDAEGNYVKLWA
ncbi:DASH family cryptochrome [Roseivirga pacifica]